MSNAMMNMLKAMGFNPEHMKAEAQKLFGRFTALEQRMEYISEDRLVFLESELQRLKDHFGLDGEGDEFGSHQRLLPEPDKSNPSHDPAA